MESNHTVIEARGKIGFQENFWSICDAEPTKIRYIWPTAIPVVDHNRHFIGQPGIVKTTEQGNVAGVGDGHWFPVDRPIVESQAIKKPRWAKVWRSGCWRRY